MGVPKKGLDPLVRPGAAGNGDDKLNKAILRKSVGRGHLEAVRLLLDRGADVNAKTEDCMTALKIAQNMGFKEIQALLRARGATE